MTDDESLDELKRKKLQELQQKIQQHEEETKIREQAELQKESILRQILEPDAKSRLTNVKLANPHLASKVEMLLLYLYQNGQLKGKVDDRQMKAILAKISGRKRKITIKRK
jgi:programmed cell death protein 5